MGAAEAVEEFRAFRVSSTVLFKDNEVLMQVGEYLSYLETQKVEEEEGQGLVGADEAEAKPASRQLQLQLAEASLYRYYADNILPEHEAGVSEEMEKTAKRGLYGRLAMALGGGLALIVPMLIMVLHPTQTKSLVVTCVFVIAVAVGLAVFMDTAEPKDIIASVAGYAAVLVVFVGLNIPT
ncbi:hypothetical protein BU26DRAFT_153088 [Trematosphaeria pertusa]|uniref:DUF6594 domain-containing protein n=1 Tax=Trematosphaeria pertusa TaxID=390896 RepID=A0A6A6J1D7_9PLEO|nr:uncharacterized protein BU26DRAFT_153088 [Trematosphaeria pertusa]KAF2255253.1 hypothetical protein BU26DRAFT_153088 [Trematosphaeria pertusa]